jgi:hypothetical protein
MICHESGNDPIVITTTAASFFLPLLNSHLGDSEIKLQAPTTKLQCNMVALCIYHNKTETNSFEYIIERYYSISRIYENNVKI